MATDPPDDVKKTARKRYIARPTRRAKTLRIVYSPDRAAIGRTLELDGTTWVIGRGSSENAPVSDPRLSRRHVRILPRQEDGAYIVEDLGGTNGTFLDGAQVFEKTALAANQVLSAGDTLLVCDEEIDPDRLPANSKYDGKEVTEVTGISFASRRLRQSIATAAHATGAVLLLGATGTGKDVAAHAIHRLSDRRDKPFVAANCAAFAPELADAKLFGTSRGDFTGAVDRRGLFEEADGGTLFLDEIGDLPAALQPKLLRVLEDGSLQSLTGAADRKVDVRVVAATNADVARTDFRRDLLGRMAWVLHLPLLSERRADILHLWERFLAKRIANAGPASYTAELAEALLLHAWPMNIRELVHLAERLTATSGADVLDLHLLPSAWQDVILSRMTHENPDEQESDEEASNRPSKAALEAALAATDGNVQLAAAANNWARTQLYRWLRYARINPNKFRKK